MITKLFARRFATAVGINRKAKILRLADKFVNERTSLIENSVGLLLNLKREDVDLYDV